MTSREESAARNRARIAIFDGLDSASLDELTVVGRVTARLALLREAGAKAPPPWWYPMCELDGVLRGELAQLRREREDDSESANAGGGPANGGVPTLCADTHHVAESVLRPHGDGAAPTYEGGPRFEALTDAERRLRAETILDVMRGLQDRATLAEIIVMSRCLQRLEVIRRQPPREPGDGPCGLDDALRLEMTDIRIEREHTAAQAEDAARDVERDRAGLTGRSANTTADERDAADACPHPFGHEWMARGPFKECRPCGAAIIDQVDNPPMLAPPDAEIEDGRVVACKSLQPDRLRRAREMAGLSLAQASRGLGHGMGRIPDFGVAWLGRIEAGDEQPTDSLIRDMSALYGVAVSWLSGADPVIDRLLLPAVGRLAVVSLHETALVRDVSRRLSIASHDDVRVVDRVLLAIELDRADAIPRFGPHLDLDMDRAELREAAAREMAGYPA